MESKQSDGAAVPVPLSSGTSGQVDWPGLLKWSLGQQSEPDQPSSRRELSEEDKKWLSEAMQANILDVPKRMKEITLVMRTPREVLQKQGVTVDDLGGILEELQEHVESIDMANDLNSIGGLDPLIGFLKDEHAAIRARAAEVISTVVQNNPRSQKDVMDHKGMEPLLSNFRSDPDITVRTKALGAISSLIRHNKAAADVFRLADGLSGLKAALLSEDSKFRRKALQVTQYLLQENPKDNIHAAELGFPALLLGLASDKQADIREAALRTLYEAVRNGQAASIIGTGELKSLLDSRIQSIQGEAAENTPKEERQLLDSLWQSCVGEPSDLRKQGLLVLAGEDEPPPDVAGKLFEPPLRRLHAEAEAVQSEREKKKKEAPPLMLKL